MLDRRLLLPKLVGLALFCLLYSWADPVKILHDLKGINAPMLAAAVAFAHLVLVTQALRSYVLLGAQRAQIPFFSFVRLYATSFAIGLVTPGRMGEVARIPLMKTYGVGLQAAVSNLVLDRAYDVVGFLCFGLVVTPFFVDIPFLGAYWLLIPVALALVGVLWRLDFIMGILSRRILSRLSAKVTQHLSGFIVPDRREQRRAVMLTVLRIALGGVVYWFAARAVGLHPGLALSAMALVGGVLASFIPLSFMGIGIRDAALLIVFSGQPAEKSQVLAFAAVILLSGLSVAVTSGLFLLFDRETLGSLRSQR